ncbi:hypothetical protein D3C75_876450 [compost metagenome]
MPVEIYVLNDQLAQRIQPVGQTSGRPFQGAVQRVVLSALFLFVLVFILVLIPVLFLFILIVVIVLILRLRQRFAEAIIEVQGPFTAMKDKAAIGYGKYTVALNRQGAEEGRIARSRNRA